MPHMQPQPCEDGCCDDCPVGLEVWIVEDECKVKWKTTNASQVDLISPWVERDIGLSGERYTKAGETYRFRAYELDPDSYETCYVEQQVIAELCCTNVQGPACDEGIDENGVVKKLPTFLISVDGVLPPSDDLFGLIPWADYIDCDVLNGSWVAEGGNCLEVVPEWIFGLSSCMLHFEKHNISLGDANFIFMNLVLGVGCPQAIYNHATGLYEWMIPVNIQAYSRIFLTGTQWWYTFHNAYFRWVAERNNDRLYSQNDPECPGGLWWEGWSLETIPTGSLELISVNRITTTSRHPTFSNTPTPGVSQSSPSWEHMCILDETNISVSVL